MFLFKGFEYGCGGAVGDGADNGGTQARGYSPAMMHATCNAHNPRSMQRAIQRLSTNQGTLLVSGMQVANQTSAPTVPQQYAVLWVNTSSAGNPIVKLCLAGSSTWLTFMMAGS